MIIKMKARVHDYQDESGVIKMKARVHDYQDEREGI